MFEKDSSPDDPRNNIRRAAPPTNGTIGATTGGQAGQTNCSGEVKANRRPLPDALAKQIEILDRRTAQLMDELEDIYRAKRFLQNDEHTINAFRAAAVIDRAQEALDRK